MATQRIKDMEHRLQITKFPLCVDKMRIALASFQKTEGQSMILRRAHILADVMDQIPIFIEPGDLIAGAAASRPFGIEMDYENGVWSKDEIESLKGEQYTIFPEDEQALYEMTEQFGRTGTLTNSAAESSTFGSIDRLWKFVTSGVVLPPFKSKTTGSGGGYAGSGIGLGPGAYLLCVEFDRVLNQGAAAIVAEAKKCLAEQRCYEGDCLQKREYWQSVILVFEAWIRFANRYADLAEKMAGEEQNDVRRRELLEMAAICRRVPEHPAASFREAIQAFWFTFLLVCPSPTASAGRFDQYMYPFYKKDITDGRITDEQVLELLELLRIKDFCINRVSGKASRAKNAGMAKWHNFTLGGVDADGHDATNELTYLMMQAAQEVRIPHHTITLRVHEGTPLSAIVKGLETVKAGVGMPAFVGDESYIRYFTNNGCSLRDARNYCMAGCVDGAIPGMTRTQAIYFMVIPHVLDIYMHRGLSKFSGEQVGLDLGDVTQAESFEDFKDGFYRELEHMCRLGGERNSIGILSMQKLFPDPFRSALMHDGVRAGTELLCRRFDPFDNISTQGAVGVVNAADALTAIRTLVFEEKKYTMAQLMAALDADWEGYEEMRQDFIRAPKYGNDLDVPDAMVTELYDRFSAYVSACTTPTGSKALASALSVSAHQPGGQITAATADGRKAGEVLADAGVSPGQGRDISGPLAVFRSAMKVHQDDFQGMLFNMKFQPSALRTQEDMEKLAQAIKVYLTHGGKHVQFNIVDRETLEDAKVSPEKHPELIVRVAGYSAYFTILTPMMQDEIIERTAFDGVR